MKKRWLVVILISLAIIVIGFLIVALFFKPQSASISPTSLKTLSNNPFADAVNTGTTNTVASPATFSMNFYKWYVANIEENDTFPTTQQLTTLFPQWATSAFILQYQSEKHDINFDEDPVLYSQDIPDGWGFGLTATVLAQTATTSSVQVVIGSGSSAQTYTVQLVMSNGQWLVNSISSPN
jgi:hypothetical protein